MNVFIYYLGDIAKRSLHLKFDIGHWSLVIIAISWLLVIPVQAIELGGYFENDGILLFKRTSGTVLGDMSRLRLKFDQKFGDSLALHLEPHYNLFVKSENIPLSGVSDLDKLVWDRVYLKYYSTVFNLTAGKQRIAWGTATIWNPTDVFNPFVISFAVREEETTNVEAVRLEVPLGSAGGIDGYILTGKPWNEAKKGGRARTTG